MEAIYNNMDIGAVEQQIAMHLPECELWGDLEVCENENLVLTNKIRQYLGEFPTARNYIAFFDRYPLCAVTQIVFYVMYEYQEKFWDAWSDTLSLSLGPNQKRDIVKRVLRQFDLRSLIYDVDGYTYITPITCQVGIPSVYLDDLFRLYSQSR